MIDRVLALTISLVALGVLLWDVWRQRRRFAEQEVDRYGLGVGTSGDGETIGPDEPGAAAIARLEIETFLNRMAEKTQFSGDERTRLRTLVNDPDPAIEERAFQLLGKDPMELSFLIGHLKAREASIMAILEDTAASKERVKAYDQFFRTKNLRLLARLGGTASSPSPLASVWNVEPEIGRRMLESHLASEFGAEQRGVIRRGRREVVPRLLAIAGDGSTDTALRSSALLGLVEVADIDDLTPVRRLLTSDLAVIRYCAVDALGQLGGSAALIDLEGMLDDPHPHVRSLVLSHLSRLNAIEVVPRIVAMLDAEPEILALAARQALVRMPAKDAVIERLLDQMPTLPVARVAVAMEILAELGARQAVPMIRANLQHAEAEVRISAANALLILREREDLPRIMAMADALSAEARSLLDEIELDVVEGQANQDLERYLVERIQTSDDPDLQYYAVQMLINEIPSERRDQPPAALLAAAKAGNIFVRGAAIAALSGFRDVASLEAIGEGLKAANDYVRVCAVTAWWRRRSEGAEKPLLQMVLEDPAEEVVMTALACLNASGAATTDRALLEIAPRLTGVPSHFVARILLSRGAGDRALLPESPKE